MTLFFLLIVLVFMLLAAIWWNPKKQRKSSSDVTFFNAFPSPLTTTDRDAVLEDEIREIVDVIRQDEAERRRAAALERLASIQATAKKTK